MRRAAAMIALALVIWLGGQHRADAWTPRQDVHRHRWHHVTAVEADVLSEMDSRGTGYPWEWCRVLYLAGGTMETADHALLRCPGRPTERWF